MVSKPKLRPTLWRTCRVLASRRRLAVFWFLIGNPGATVSTVASHLRLPLSEASRSLRLLQSRSLVLAGRAGRYVTYRIFPVSAENTNTTLIIALKKVFDRQSRVSAIDTIFQAATAFTHPRRIDIVRALKSGARNFAQIRTATGISSWAVARHLKKLKDRQYVTDGATGYRIAHRITATQRALLRIATLDTE